MKNVFKDVCFAREFVAKNIDCIEKTYDDPIKSYLLIRTIVKAYFYMVPDELKEDCASAALNEIYELLPNLNHKANKIES